MTASMLGFLLAGAGFLAIAVLRLVAEAFYVAGFTSGVGAAVAAVSVAAGGAIVGARR